MAVQLPYTLQTYVGMVQNRGAPQTRKLPRNKTASAINVESQAGQWWFEEICSYAALVRHSIHRSQIDLAAQYLLNHNVKPETIIQHTNAGLHRYEANLGACTVPITKQDLKKWILSRTRFDLEQAAAIVIAAFHHSGRKADAARLIKQAGVVLTTSCMWLEDDVPLPISKSPLSNPINLSHKIQASALKRGIHSPLATNYAELVPQLMRVRRSKPDNRCLHIPQWMFKEAGIENPPEHFRRFFGKRAASGEWPVAPADESSIILSRRHFRSDQRHIYQLFKFWLPDVNLRKRIKRLEDDVLYGGNWVRDHVCELDDLGLLAYYFFACQRRLQKKVVSSFDGRAFLGKGEGAKIYQNNVSVKSTFEDVLLGIAEGNEEGVIVAMGEDNTVEMLDETCRLMKEYVDVFGGGNKANLVFTRDRRQEEGKKAVNDFFVDDTNAQRKYHLDTYAPWAKPAQQGGSGRGPVDDYNLLCDILAQLKVNAKEEGIKDVPGPVRKFLAKDIMAWNNAWKDDAFAAGFVPGWETWLAERGSKKEEKSEKGDEGWEFVEW